MRRGKLVPQGSNSQERERAKPTLKLLICCCSWLSIFSHWCQLGYDSNILASLHRLATTVNISSSSPHGGIFSDVLFLICGNFSPPSQTDWKWKLRKSIQGRLSKNFWKGSIEISEVELLENSKEELHGWVGSLGPSSGPGILKHQGRSPWEGKETE